MLQTAACNNYITVHEGYDELFGYCVSYMDNLVPTVLPEEFMFNYSTTEESANIPNTGFGCYCMSFPSFHSSPMGIP